MPTRMPEQPRPQAPSNRQDKPQALSTGPDSVAQSPMHPREQNLSRAPWPTYQAYEHAFAAPVEAWRHHIRIDGA